MAKQRAPAGGNGIDYLLEESVGYLVRDSFRAFSKALQTRIARHGVTMGQWYFLRVLWEEDGLTQRELSRRVGMMEPTTVSALNTMQKAALIRRQRNEQDRRKVNIFLTKKGAALKEELLPDAIAVNEAAVAGVSPEEVETLRRVLDRIKSNLE